MNTVPKSSYTVGMLESLEELVLEVECKPVMTVEDKAHSRRKS